MEVSKDPKCFLHILSLAALYLWLLGERPTCVCSVESYNCSVIQSVQNLAPVVWASLAIAHNNPALTQICSFFFFNFFNVYLFLTERERETEREWGRGRQRGRHRIRSRLQTPSCQHGARRGARAHRPELKSDTQPTEPPRRP